MYIEASSNNHVEDVYVRLEQTDLIQINNIIFYQNRFSILTNDSLRLMGRFQLLLSEGSWSIRYNIPKNHRCSASSTDLTVVSLNFTAENYGTKKFFDRKETAHDDFVFQ